MLGCRSRLQARAEGGARAVLTRPDYQLLRSALSEAGDAQAAPVRAHLEDWARYTGAAARVVAPLTGQQLEVVRTAVRAHIGARPVADTTAARRLYDRLVRPRQR
ncbi:hypothetical protein [Pseudactinotalea terrae]|uniref:hypothetical protein n=1 Tax=Pseudactinotalea terrae TaxID=1743262 RepID=UPI0012E0D7D4|nr:hypothetical protein [Pseudactinotalea terrae]